MFYRDERFPPHSIEVQNVEEKYLKDYGEKRRELDDGLKNAMLPYRPNYGSKGEQVILWANYFHLRFNETAKFYKYDVVICDPEKKSSANNKDDGKAKDGRVTGRKAKNIFEVLLDQVRNKNEGIVFATDFKQKVVTTASLKPLPKTIVYPLAQGNSSHQYDLTISEQRLDVGSLVSFLKNQAQTPKSVPSSNPDSNGFPFYQDIIDAIGTITGHAPRESQDTVNVGRSRFFSKTSDDLSSNIGNSGILQILKGFSQSVRPAAGRLLLNVNVTHGIFRPHGKISDLFGMFDTKEPERSQNLHEIVSKARVRYHIPSAKKGDESRSKVLTIAGLGLDTDRCSNNEDNPTFPQGKRFGDVHEVEFCLKKSPRSSSNAQPAQGLQWGKRYSVFEYFYRSKFIPAIAPFSDVRLLYLFSQYRSRIQTAVGTNAVLTAYQYQPQPKFPVVNIGRPTDPMYVPAECCELLDLQPIRSELDAKESEDMTDFAVKTPKENADWISGSGRNDVLKLTPATTVLNHFGVTIEPQLITVKARRLNSPRIIYSANPGQNKRVFRTAQSASWNLKDLSFHTCGKSIDRWAWIFFSSDKDNPSGLKDRVETFRNCLVDLGVRIASEADGIAISYREGDNIRDVYDSITTAVKDKDLEFVLVILPKVQADIYTAVKLVGDIGVGFHTVCVTAKNFSKDPPGVLGLYANLATKINLKFGGVNHVIDKPYELFKESKSMIVGYDVVHPTGVAGNVGDTESQVGLVASIDQDFGQWRSRYWTQKANQEIVGSKLAYEFKDQLKTYKAKEGALPVNVLIYRDGVSEGQYLQVLKEELPHIAASCREIYEEAQQKSPSITLVVSVKRHATRFFPTSLAKLDKSNNIQSGTIIDRGVTQARCWDFYLKSHTALSGTAHPTHYVVLHDEIFRPRHLKGLPKHVSAGDVLAAGKRAAEDLEEVTHELCYIYGRATKAISISTPARYADIVCTRARLHAAGLARLASRPGLSQKEKDVILAKTVHPNLKNTMYWI